MNKFLIGTAVVIVATVGYFTFSDYSDGERSGQIVKFSYKGNIPGCKTWEGQLVLGGLRGQSAVDGTGANLFDFTVNNRETMEKIKRKLASGDHALVTYKQPFWNWPCSTDTGYFVTDVK
jgi:hypothetical protein